MEKATLMKASNPITHGVSLANSFDALQEDEGEGAWTQARPHGVGDEG